MKLWGGRFEKDLDRDVLEFTTSFGIDQRLWPVDIDGSIAHARMLGAQGILSAADSAGLVKALTELKQDIAEGKVVLDPNAEDVHSAIEVALNQKIGALSGRLHTARSRNDQVATDVRLYLRGQIDELRAELKELQTTLFETAEKHTTTVLSGMTHFQHAQPVSLAHHLLTYFWMLDRDIGRLADCRERMNLNPLGAAALAGTGFPLDRKATAQELGFAGPIPNSLDAVSDRDFIVEFLSAGSLIMMHYSRLCEELIIWSTPEFGFVELGDEVTTGSSIMPQKKNPDVAELIRGRVGQLYGNLMGALTMMKGLPLAYNRDMQEDKVYLFEGLDLVRVSTRMMNLMLQKASWKPERMAASLAGDFSNATDLADDLVRKGLPFREAHEVIGRLVRQSLETGVALEKMKLEDLKKCSSLFDEASLKVIPHLTVMNARISEGGAGVDAVKAQLQVAKTRLATK
ncbi:MAG: argininosuccinate lyase [Bdellovibrionaceae bacterium]|nr:argininosuccinate lyase [Pseudobdellovibrionaceae bacterium]